MNLCISPQYSHIDQNNDANASKETQACNVSGLLITLGWILRFYYYVTLPLQETMDKAERDRVYTV